MFYQFLFTTACPTRPSFTQSSCRQLSTASQTRPFSTRSSCPSQPCQCPAPQSACSRTTHHLPITLPSSPPRPLSHLHPAPPPAFLPPTTSLTASQAPCLPLHGVLSPS